MEPLFIKATKQSPKVLLDKDKGLIEISGKSRPEDALLFYGPIHKWICEYKENPNPVTKVILQLEYFNSASAKHINHILSLLQKIIGNGYQVNVDWHYFSDDEDMKDVGEDLCALYELPCKLIPS